MRISRFFIPLMILVISACQVRPVTPAPTGALPTQALSTALPSQPPVLPSVTPSPMLQPSPTPSPLKLFDLVNKPFAQVQLKTYPSGTYAGQLDALPIQLAALGNPEVIQGLTAQQKEFLSANGFVVMNAGDTQFKDLRRTVSSHYGQPYYLTVDAAYHALHITFDDLLAALEREYMRPVLARLLQAEYSQVVGYAATSAGTPLEKDVELSQNFLAVALKLLDPGGRLDPQVETRVALQIAQIMGYGGRAPSLLIPGLEEDYGAYRPVGHYAGVPELEEYFRCMTWLGRVAFKFKDPDTPGLVPSRAPLIMTLALREALVEGQPAHQVWSGLNAIMDFMVGPSDDPGPVEINALMEQIYGRSLIFADLADEGKWQTFLAKVDRLPAPQLNSTFASFSAVQAISRDWRFLGQRFTLDGFIFQNLIYDKVGTRQNPRSFPSGLDVAAAFGSPQAYQALDAAGETRYANYSQQMSAVQQVVANQPEGQWLNRFYSAWLYAFRPQVSPKDSGFPPYMRTAAWGYKAVNSMLGSWAELKHDTVLYAKMPEAMGGGGPPVSGPAPGYVEPDPDVFYRLAYAAAALSEGLLPYINAWDTQQWHETSLGGDGASLKFSDHYRHLTKLAQSFQDFGEIAARELQGQTLTTDDYETIQICLELKECLDMGMYSRNPPAMDPIPVVVAVSGAQDRVLEAGIGNLNRIYVAVPLEGKLEIAQGGVFSYYEFTQPRSDRLTDQSWIEMLDKNPPSAPAWAAQFVLPGGEPKDSLAFRIGDVYFLTERGYNPPLNLRAGPSKVEAVLRTLNEMVYLEIKDGPVKNAEGTWWKVELLGSWTDGRATEGWVFENPEWFERSVIQ